MRLTPLFIILLLSLAIPSLRAEKSETPPPPTDCYQRYLRMPSAGLLRHGYNFLYHSNFPDSAMLCFTIVAERSDQAATRRQREECFDAWCGRWETNNWAYNNYEACIEDYKQLTALQEKWGIRSAQPLYFKALYKINEFNIDPAGNRVEDAIALMKEALNKSIDLNDKELALRCFNNLIRTTFFHSNEKFEKEHERLAKLLGENDRGYRIADALYSAACNYIDGKKSQSVINLDKAIALYDTARLNLRSARDLTSLIFTKASLYYMDSRYSEAEKTWLEVINATYRYDQREMRHIALEMLAELYQITNQRDKLEEAMHHAVMLKDSIWNTRITRGLSQIRFNDEHKEMQRQMAVMEYRQKVLRWLILGAAVVIICFALFIYSLRRANRKLRERTEALYDRINSTTPVGAYHDANAVGAHHGAPEKTPVDTPEIITTHAPMDVVSGTRAPEMVTDAGTRAPENISTGAPLRDTAPRQIMQPDVRDRLAAEIDKVMTRTEAPFSGDFSLTRLAQSVGSNTRYVSHVINEVFGSNFQTYVNSVRIREACRRIDDHATYGNYSTEAIGETVGFNSRSAFATAFKKITSLSPSEYRKISIQRAKKAKR